LSNFNFLYSASRFLFLALFGRRSASNTLLPASATARIREAHPAAYPVPSPASRFSALICTLRCWYFDTDNRNRLPQTRPMRPNHLWRFVAEPSYLERVAIRVILINNRITDTASKLNRWTHLDCSTPVRRLCPNRSILLVDGDFLYIVCIVCCLTPEFVHYFLSRVASFNEDSG